MTAKIGYYSIEWHETRGLRVCETPLHKDQMKPAFAVIAIEYEENDELLLVVQMVCYQCWQHFDNNLDNPDWNLEELEYRKWKKKID